MKSPCISFYNGAWVVDEDFTVQGITVPKDFQSDLASIPRILWSIYPPFGTYQTGAIVHDYLYTYKTVDRRLADYTFIVIMKEDGVDVFTRHLFYTAVRMFGWLYY